MKSIYQIGDVHFGTNNNNKLIFEETLKFFSKQVFPSLLNDGCNHVIFYGDLFDDRTKIDSYILQELKDKFFSWFDQNNIIAHFIVGNHDLYFKNTRTHHHYKENINEFKNCIYYDAPTVVKLEGYNFLMVPWLLEDEPFPDTTGIDIVAGHFDFVGFEMVKGKTSTKGIDTEQLLNSVKLVMSGHFHNQQCKINKKGNVIQYLGSVNWLNWNDFKEPKGIWKLKDNFILEHIPNTINPKFVKLIYDAGDVYMEG